MEDEVAVPARRIPEDFDPASTDDPDEVHALYRDLRVRCPVAHTDAHGGFWALTTYPEVKAAALDDSRFISSVKAVVPSGPPRPRLGGGI